MKTLDGKVVVITGAGSGIGRALALECVGRGARLALSDVDDEGLAETVRQVSTGSTTQRTGSNSGAPVQAAHLDVADRAAFATYATEVVSHFGRVNVVINNAGVSLSGDFVDLNYPDMEWIVGINFWGVLHGTQEFLPHLIASGDGHIVNVSSVFGLMSVPSQSLYNATKYAVRGMSESIREELLIAGHPVGMTVVHPGGIKTAIARSARYAEAASAQQTIQAFDQKLARMTPERAAEIIVRGVLKNKARVLVGVDAHALHQVARLTGSRYQDIVARVLRGRPLGALG